MHHVIYAATKDGMSARKPRTPREQYLRQCSFQLDQLLGALPLLKLVTEYLCATHDDERRPDIRAEIRTIGRTASFFGGNEAMRYLLTGLEEAFMLDEHLVANHIHLRHAIAPCLNQLWAGIGDWQA